MVLRPSFACECISQVLTMEPWGYYAVGASLTSGSLDAESWVNILGCFLLFAAVIYLMCHTADNYFSPVLAAMCDLLDMRPEVAGVTLLAFGNGAPDVFSAFAALTSGMDKEAGLLVGMGSLLGSAIFTVTLIVGSVVYLKPTEVPRVPFTRDLVFLVFALALILVSTSVGSISIWLATAYLALYAAYVTIVLNGPAAGGGNRSAASPMFLDPESMVGLEVGGLGGGLDDHAAGARWIGDEARPPKSKSTASSPLALLNNNIHGNAVGAGAGLAGDSSGGKVDGVGVGVAGGDDGRRGLSVDSAAAPAAPAQAGMGRAPTNDEFSAHGNCVRHDYFAVDGGEEEGRSLLSGGGGGGGGRRPGGGDGPDGGWGSGGGVDVFSMVSGRTVTMFLEEDDSAASWLGQRRCGGGGGGAWGWGSSDYRANADASEPLLRGYSSQNSLWNGPQKDGGARGESASWGAFSMRARAGDGALEGSSAVRRRFEHAWTTLQWRQWRLRRRVRRELGNSDVLQLPWCRRVFRALELPFILIRNATIPPVEADSWSQTQAAVATGLAPALIIWAFGLWEYGVLGVHLGWVALLAGPPAGVAVWLTTHRRRMPRDRWYRLGLALLSFSSCVAWIYFLADLAVAMIDRIGTATGIPGSVLGLTLLAWGNSAGDLVTNLAVARAGFPGMAIAGSYGGPLFNVLLGVGLPTFFTSVRYYPTAAVFELDASTVFTASMVILVLVGTLLAVALSGFCFPNKTPLALLGLYGTYVVGAVIFTLR